MNDFWDDLGITPPSGPLEEPIRVRIDGQLRDDLNRIEAFVRGAGYRDISRSDLVRAALKSFVDGIRETIPEVADVTLPSERNQQHHNKTTVA